MQPRLPAHWAAENWPETAFWASPGHGKVLLPWAGLPPIWTVGGVQMAIQGPLGAQHRVEYLNPEGAQGPEAPP